MEGSTQGDSPATGREVSSTPSAQESGSRGRRLAEVFERSSSPMLMVDDERIHTDVNRAAVRLLRRPAESIVGRRIDDLAAPHLRAAIPDQWARFLALGSMADSYEYIGGDGQPVAFDYSATANVLPERHLLIVLQSEEPLEPPRARGVAPARGDLTPRERQVLRMVAMGNTGQEIAQALVVSPETVSTHMRNIREKLGARSRAHALAVALRRGEIDVWPDP